MGTFVKEASLVNTLTYHEVNQMLTEITSNLTVRIMLNRIKLFFEILLNVPVISLHLFPHPEQMLHS